MNGCILDRNELGETIIQSRTGSYKHRKRPKGTEKDGKDTEKDRKGTEKDRKDTEKDLNHNDNDTCTWLMLETRLI